MSLADAYDPESFRTAGHQLVDALAGYLARAKEGGLPVLPVADPEALLREVDAEFPAEGKADLVSALMKVVERSNHVHHPGYVGHQVSAPMPTAVLAEMAHGLLNNGMAIFEMGQMHTVMERYVVEFLTRQIGWSASSGGVLTHGGSLGNFTALLAIRQAKAGHDAWSEGLREPLAVLVSEQAHYCVGRSVQAMGWGEGGAVAVPTDERYRMRVDRLEQCLEAARRVGRRVIAVVASSCSTATGSFDPLNEIADFCAEHDLWLHVDGAHGASLTLSERFRDRVRGIERADSVVWDLHKLMGLPALNTAVLFKDRRLSYGAFAQEAGYLFESDASLERWTDIGLRTMECTKRGLGVTAYCMLQSQGLDVFEANIDRLMVLAEEFAARLRELPDFELAVDPEANIVCFRYVPSGAEDVSALQVRLRQAVLASGRFYLVQAELRGETWLRVSLMNPFTTLGDLERMLIEIREFASAG